jgi:hypothetical protein
VQRASVLAQAEWQSLREGAGSQVGLALLVHLPGVHGACTPGEADACMAGRDPSVRAARSR